MTLFEILPTSEPIKVLETALKLLTVYDTIMNQVEQSI